MRNTHPREYRWTLVIILLWIWVLLHPKVLHMFLNAC